MQGLGSLNGNDGGGSKKAGFTAKPKAVMCYICGKDYGTKSIGIHLKACQKKFAETESQKPKN